MLLYAISPGLHANAATIPDSGQWYRLVTTQASGERQNRCIELLSADSQVLASVSSAQSGMLWSNSLASPTDSHYDYQFWQFVLDPDGSGLFAMVNKAIPDGSVNPTPTTPNMAGRWTYDVKKRHYGFILDTQYHGVTNKGIIYYAITSTALTNKPTDQWMNIAAGGQSYAVNCYKDPTDAGGGLFYFYPANINPGDETPDDKDPEGKDPAEQTGDGTEASPYSVSQALEINTSDRAVWVHGFINGVMYHNQFYDNYSLTQFPSNDNIVIGENTVVKRTDTENFLQVKFSPNRGLEEELGLNLRPGNSKKEITIIGRLRNGVLEGAYQYNIVGGIAPIQQSEVSLTSLQVKHNELFDINGDGIMDFAAQHPSLKTNIFCSLQPYGSSYKTPIIYSSAVTANPLGVLPDGNIYFMSSTNSKNQLYRMVPTSDNIAPIRQLSEKYTIIPVDYNLDGTPDFIVKEGSGDEKGHSLVISSDGSIAEDRVSVMTPLEYAGIRQELKLSSGGEGIPGVGEEMYGRPGPGNTSLGDWANVYTVDVNNDALPDIAFYSNSNHMLNAGSNILINTSLGVTNSIYRDLDGDGLNDVAYYDDTNKVLNVVFNERNGATQQVPLYSGLTLKNSFLYCADIDNDGDIDIISTVYGDDTYALIVENLGNRKFRKREFLVGSNMILGDVKDINADGKYEILINSGEAKLCYMTIESPSKLSELKTLATNIDKEADVKLVNADNSGTTTIMTTLYRTPISSKLLTFSSLTKNKRPIAPQKPKLSFNEATGMLLVEWGQGSDAETPVADLTYELRVGTAPGLSDLMTPQALADGRRRNSRAGTQGYDRRTSFNTASWPIGKVYVSVQTVDGNYLGSPFSTEAVWEKTTPTSEFTISAIDRVAIHQPVELRVKQPHDGASLKWDFGENAIIKSGSDESETATICYSTPGVKTIKLTVNQNGRSSTSLHTLDIASAYMSSFKEGSIDCIIDIDEDGFAEPNINGSFFTENESGEFEKVKKLFNTTATAFSRGDAFYDIDRNGYIDIIHSTYESSSRTFTTKSLLNYGDSDMETSYTSNIPKKPVTWSGYDFNNDGKMDSSINGGDCEWLSDKECIAINTGDYINLEQKAIKISPMPGSNGFVYVDIFYYDFNGDGLIDICYKPIEPDGGWTENIMYMCENIDGYTFKEGVPVPGTRQEASIIDDLDGDGKADFVFCEGGSSFGVSFYGEYITILWGSGAPMTAIQCPDGKPFYMVYGASDMDNDGMKDLSVRYSKGGEGIVFIKKDGTYEHWLGNINGYNTGGTSFLRRNGNRLTNRLEIENAYNQRPSAPTALRSVQNSKAVVIEWNPGSDAETPTKGLRYNISIKHKGAEGPGAYLISPLNGENETAALPAPVYYQNCTKFTIPIASIAPGEYEVRVQTIDWQGDASPFTPVYPLKVVESSVIDMPTSAMVDNPVKVKLMSNSTSAEVDFGIDAEATKNNNSEYTVTWHSQGLKMIKINNSAVGQIFVHPQPSVSFTLPEKVLVNSTVIIPAEEANKGVWQTNGQIISNNTSTELIASDSTFITVRFTEVGTHSINRLREETFGVVNSPIQTIEVVAENAEPTIASVVADADNHYTIHFDTSNRPEDAVNVKVWRETSRYNNYELIATDKATSVRFTDLESRADVKAGRYRISYVLPYGESARSSAHQPIHVQINKGVGGAINLLWSQYEGLQIESYRILRGKSASELEVFDVVSGHASSFSDTKPSVSEPYYAIELIVPATGHNNAPATFANEAPAPRSNVVSTADAIDAVLATSVGITTSTGERDVIFGRGATGLQLSAHFMPVNTTVTRVNWEVVQGDNMTIDHYGNVAATGLGTAVIRATACDGSGAYGEIELCGRVPDDFIFVESLGIEYDSYELHPGETLTPKVEVLPANAEVKTLKWTSLTPNIVQVDSNGSISVVDGIETGTGYIRVETTDGSNIYDTLTVYVTQATIRVAEIIPAQKEYTLRCGESVKIELTILPENATNKTILWSSWDKSLATVTQEGVVTANNLGKTGTVKIGADATDGPGVIADVFTDILINIIPAEVKVKTLLIERNYYALTEGEQVQINTTILPENATNKVLKWSSDNPEIASIDSNGVVTGLSGGNSTIIHVETTDGSELSGEINVEVRAAKPQPIKVSEIVCTPESVVLIEGQSYQIKAEVRPENATNQDLRWSSLRPEIATVDANGLIAAISEGTSEILVEACDDSGVSQTIAVTVTRQSGIDSQSTDLASISVEGTDVVVRNVPIGQAVRLYSTSGRLLRSEVSSGHEMRFRNLNGSIIVVADSKTRIVAIK